METEQEKSHPMLCVHHGGSPSCEDSNKRHGFECPKCLDEREKEQAKDHNPIYARPCIEHGGDEFCEKENEKHRLKCPKCEEREKSHKILVNHLESICISTSSCLNTSKSSSLRFFWASSNVSLLNVNIVFLLSKMRLFIVT